MVQGLELFRVWSCLGFQVSGLALCRFQVECVDFKEGTLGVMGGSCGLDSKKSHEPCRGRIQYYRMR